MAGRSFVPATRACPVTGSVPRHSVVWNVQPSRRTIPPSSDSSTFWP